MDRVEIELQPIKKRQASDDYKRRAGDEENAVPLQEIIQRRQKRNSQRLRLARRVQQTDKGGQDRDAGGEGDQHAEAGDEAQFRHAAVVGWQERKEARRRRRGGEGERYADEPARLQESTPQIVELMTLGAVAHAELDGKIDADADEQYREIDRDQVESAYHHQTERGSQCEPDEEIDEHRDDETPGT